MGERPRSHDRRRSARAPVAVPAILRLADRTMTGRTTDLSTRGVGLVFRSSAPLLVGQEVLVELVPPAEGEALGLWVVVRWLGSERDRLYVGASLPVLEPWEAEMVASLLTPTG